MSHNKTKVLFLSKWYPHRYDAMEGLFVRKHAMAVSRFVDVCVLFLYADSHISKHEIVEQSCGSVKEIYVYYPYSTVTIFRKLSIVINYFRAFRKGYSYLKSHWGKPDIVHANVLTRTGVLAYMIHRKEHIPYVVMEHWTRYLPDNNSYSGFVRKKLTAFVVRHAQCIIPVSSDLQEAMLAHGLYNAQYCVVGNVVDDFFYESRSTLYHEKKRILHVSCFIERAKNLSGLLRVIHHLSDERNDFELVIVGYGPDYAAIVREAQNLQLLDTLVYFVGEQTPEQVCDWMHTSDFFVLSSNYENCPVVILESLASGLPVVSTSVGNTKECVTPKNGKLVPIGDEDAMYEVINWMLDNYHKYNIQEIQESAQCFRFEHIGKQLVSIYQSAIERS